MLALRQSTGLVVATALIAVGASWLVVLNTGLGLAHPESSQGLLGFLLLAVNTVFLGTTAFLVALASRLRSVAFFIAAVGLVALAFLLLCLSGIAAALALRVIASVVHEASVWEMLYQTAGVALALPVRTMLSSLAIALLFVPLLLRGHRKAGDGAL